MTTPHYPAPESINLAAATWGSQVLSHTPALQALLSAEPIKAPSPELAQSWPSNANGQSELILSFGLPGELTHLEFDTTFLLDETPHHLSAWGLHHPDPWDSATLAALPASAWQPLLSQVRLLPHQSNTVPLTRTARLTHLRIQLDSGLLMRVRAFGQPKADWSRHIHGTLADLASLTLGGEILALSTLQQPLHCPLNHPGDAGLWSPPSDQAAWVLFKLARPGAIRELSCTIPAQAQAQTQLKAEGLFVPRAALSDLWSKTWKPLLAPQSLASGQAHHLREGFAELGPLTHVRVSFRPGLSLSRLSLWGDEGEL